MGFWEALGWHAADGVFPGSLASMLSFLASIDHGR
jgi:hypothetical protein